MNERSRLLEGWGLSPALARLAAGVLPHPLFGLVCEVIQPHHRVPSWDEVEYDALDRDRPRTGVPLWGREFGGARYYEVVYTTWRGDYKLLEAYGKAMKGEK